MLLKSPRGQWVNTWTKNVCLASNLIIYHVNVMISGRSCKKLNLGFIYPNVNQQLFPCVLEQHPVISGTLYELTEKVHHKELLKGGFPSQSASNADMLFYWQHEQAVEWTVSRFANDSRCRDAHVKPLWWNYCKMPTARSAIWRLQAQSLF